MDLYLNLFLLYIKTSYQGLTSFPQITIHCGFTWYQSTSPRPLPASTKGATRCSPQMPSWSLTIGRDAFLMSSISAVWLDTPISQSINFFATWLTLLAYSDAGLNCKFVCPLQVPSETEIPVWRVWPNLLHRVLHVQTQTHTLRSGRTRSHSCWACPQQA